VLRLLETFSLVELTQAIEEALEPSVITLKPATCDHFKTGHFGWPET
jgi:hypothetical protein